MLAIDLGKKRSGIAVTDPLRITSNPLTTVSSPEIISWLKQYLKDEPVDIIVLGYPLRTNGEATHMTAEVISFRKRLAKVFPEIPVDLEEEQYTSKAAVDIMVQGGMKKKDRRNKANIDKIAANIILQAYLERTER